MRVATKPRGDSDEAVVTKLQIQTDEAVATSAHTHTDEVVVTRSPIETDGAVATRPHNQGATEPRTPAEAAPTETPLTHTDEATARRDLRGQIARLEGELSELSGHAPIAVRGGPRLLSLAELEGVRDRLAARTAGLRRALDERGEMQEAARRTLEEVILDPAEHRWVQVSREQIGEPGCGTWHARPRFGLLGMLMNWWRVKISSGCPLPGQQGGEWRVTIPSRCPLPGSQVAAAD